MTGYTSRDAYNGCLSLYSLKERQERGDVLLYGLVFHSSSGTRKVIGKGFSAHVHELRKSFLESQYVDPLPSLNVESVDDIIATSDEIELYSPPMIDNTKIQVIEDDRSFDTLRDHFKQLPLEFVTHVWMGQETWGACYDILSTLRASDHNSFTFTFIFDPISDPMSWPTLQYAYPRFFVSMSRSRSNSNRSILLLRESDVDSHNHDIISLSNSSLSGFSWHICANDQQNIDDDETKSIGNMSEVSWEVLPNDFVERARSYPHPDHSEILPLAPTPVPEPLNTSHIKSYKEALLTEVVDLQPLSPCIHIEQPKFTQLTQVFPQAANCCSDMESFDDYWEVDTYVDWLEASYGSKETSIAALSRARIHCAKISHVRKKKSSNNYYRKHAR